MSGFPIANDYPHSPAKVWRASTDPQIVPLWTVQCEVLEAREPFLLCYS